MTREERDSPILESKLLAYVQGSRIAISMADATQPDCPLIFVNRAFSDITGYDNEECVGRNCRFLQGDRRGQTGTAQLRAFLKNPKLPSLCVTLINTRKSGDEFRNMLTIGRLTDQDHVTRYFLASQFDLGGSTTDELNAYQKRLQGRFEGIGAIAKDHELIMYGSLQSLAAGVIRVAQAHLTLAERPD